ncbi:AMP-binding protein [uncultured Cetobacterium sp.]|uniref:AMP-binding protein n=1 Tax=uncultured Cetobacterium sp. TaxID=527638 RepID=UPI0025EA241E|nr:AMP-binding protein [uncultured Cetobacterium sp.]
MNFIYDRKKTAVVYKDKEYSYYELIKMAKIYSELLNIEKEDRVVVFMENRPEYMAAVLGVWDKKGTCTNLDASYNSDQLEYVFNDSHPKYIITSNENIEVVNIAKLNSNSDIIILNVDEIDIKKEIRMENVAIECLEKEAVAVMLYTSGTTGNPKGVMLTFDNIMSNVEAIKEIKMVGAEDRLLALLPFHHILPLSFTVLMPLNFGCFVVILDELSSEAIKRNLQKYKITIVIGVPRVWEMFHKGIMGKIKSSPVTYKLFNICKSLNIIPLNKIIFKKIQEAFGGNINFLVSGGAKLDKEICEDFNAFGFKMLEGYGLTETSPIISFNRKDNIIPGTVGVPLPGVKVKLETDGEIVVKGRNVMKGYYNKPEATAEAIDEDGWFHTGDLGQFDGDHLKIIGRKKEMIVLSNGKNINPSDVEAEIIRETDLIEEVAVTEYHKHLVAIVYPNFKVLEERGIANAKDALKWEVIDKYNVTAPAYRKILDIVVVKEELPKTKLGKLRRFMLKDLVAGVTAKIEGSEDEIAPSKTVEKKISTSKEINTEEFKQISKFINTLHDDAHIIPESHLEIDLGLDSLDIVEIITYIQNTFGVTIAEEDFARIKTVEALCQFVREKGGNFEEGEVNWKKIFDEPVELDMPTSKVVVPITNILKPLFTHYIKLEKNTSKLQGSSPVIYVGNHQSMLDAFAFSQTLPKDILKNTYFLAINIHFEGKVKKYLAQNGNVILVDMNKNLKETLKIAAKVLKEGKNLVIFPEGARTRDGEIQEFKKTFAILSKELNIPVVPFAIKGAYELMPYGKNKPSSGKMSVTILDKVSSENKTVEEILKLTKQEIMNSLNS